MNHIDPTLLQAIRQADAAWTMAWEARRTFYLTVAGVAANFLLAFVAVAVPAWQRSSERRDAKQRERKAWDRFIEAFTAVSDAQNAVFVASQSEYPASAFTTVEPQLQRAIEALEKVSAAELPVGAILNAVAVQQKAKVVLGHFPDLKLYGRNLFTDGTIMENMTAARDDTALLLKRTKEMVST